MFFLATRNFLVDLVLSPSQARLEMPLGTGLTKGDGTAANKNRQTADSQTKEQFYDS